MVDASREVFRFENTNKVFDYVPDCHRLTPRIEFWKKRDFLVVLDHGLQKFVGSTPRTKDYSSAEFDNWYSTFR